MQETCLRALSSLVRLPQADAMPISRLPMSFCMGFSVLVFETGCVYGCVFTYIAFENVWKCAHVCVYVWVCALCMSMCARENAWILVCVWACACVCFCSNTRAPQGVRIIPAKSSTYWLRTRVNNAVVFNISWGSRAWGQTQLVPWRCKYRMSAI